MRITDLLDRRSISLDGAPTGKKDALDQMVELMARGGRCSLQTACISDRWLERRSVRIARRPAGRFWNDHSGCLISTLLLGFLKKNVV